MLEAANEQDQSRTWDTVVNRWTPSQPGSGTLPSVELRLVIARLAANGLWLCKFLTSTRLDPTVCEQVAGYLASLTDMPEPDTPENRQCLTRPHVARWG